MKFKGTRYCILIFFAFGVVACTSAPKYVVFNPYGEKMTLQISIRNIAKLHDMPPAERAQLLIDSGFSYVSEELGIQDTSYYSDGLVSVSWKGNEFVRVNAIQSHNWSKRLQILLQSEIKKLKDEKRLVEKDKNFFFFKRKKAPNYYVEVIGNNQFLGEITTYEENPRDLPNKKY